MALLVSLAALRVAEITGEGQHIDMCMLDAALPPTTQVMLVLTVLDTALLGDWFGKG